VDLEAGWAGGVQDRGDPNYDSDQEADRHMRLKTTPIGNTTDCKKEARYPSWQSCSGDDVHRPGVFLDIRVSG